MREDEGIVAKVAKINKLRSQRSADIVAKGGEPLEPYTFDYFIACNKICGASHYNMQMKLVVHEQDDFNKWLKEKQTLSAAIKESQNKAEEGEVLPADADAPAQQPAAADSTNTAAVVPDSTKVAQVTKK
jgi:cytochrome c oxidase subunit 2